MANAATSNTASDREKLRAERKLRPLNRAEEGSAIDLLAGGVYGFTYSPGTEGVPLYSNWTFQCFEAHKLFNGSLHLLGYLSDADFQAFESSKATTELKLYPDLYEDARKFVSVPQERVLKAKPASRDQGNFVSFLCLPKE